MRLPPYPKYKPSGVEWLGDVPEHWVVQRLRYVCRFAYGDALASEEREDGEVPVFGSNGPVGTHRSANTRRPVVVIGRKGSHGKVNYSASEAFAIDTTYFIDNRFTRSDLRWLFYTLGALGLDAVSKDSAVPGLAREDAYAHATAVPSIDEQRAIADFLDRETAKIDTLVAKKRTLIERLKEKRTALISRTVTRGLPPDAARAAGLDPHPKLKPSGIDWLGDVPEYWSVTRLSHVAACLDGRRIPLNREERSERQGPYPYWGANGIVDSIDGWLFDEPLVLLGEDGAPFFATNKEVAFFVSGKIWVNNHAHVLRPATGIDGRFLALALNQTEYGAFIDGSTRDKLTQDDMNAIPIATPPHTEQRAIADFLDRETAKIDTMVAKVETAIERLQEYRTALITAAVTGKIDVRGAAA